MFLVWDYSNVASINIVDGTKEVWEESLLRLQTKRFPEVAKTSRHVEHRVSKDKISCL